MSKRKKVFVLLFIASVVGLGVAVSIAFSENFKKSNTDFTVQVAKPLSDDFEPCENREKAESALQKIGNVFRGTITTERQASRQKPGDSCANYSDAVVYSASRACQERRGSFLDFLWSLGGGFAFKATVMLKIQRSPEKYKYLSKISDWDNSFVSQLLDFMGSHSPFLKDLLKMHQSGEKQAAENLKIDRLPMAKENWKYDLDKAMLSRCKMRCMPARPTSECLTAAIQSLFTIPEVFTDLVTITSSKINRLEEAWSTSEGIQKFNLIRESRGIPEVYFHTFIRAIHMLSEAALETELGDRSEKSQASLSRIYDDLCEILDIPCMDSVEHLANTYRILYAYMTILYEIYPMTFMDDNLLGVGVVLPDQYLESIFYVRTEKNKSSIQANLPSKFDVKSDFVKIELYASKDPLQHIYYVDNEKQCREVVIVPIEGAYVMCWEIIDYISVLHKKPKSNIHVLSYSLEDKKWSYKDPETTQYLKESPDSSEILVFYYIKQACSAIDPIDLYFVGFLEATKPCREPDHISLPLFFTKLLVNSIALLDYNFVSGKIAPISSFSQIDAVSPFLYSPSQDRNAFAYYQNNTVPIRRENTGDIDIDLEIAKSSLVREKTTFSHEKDVRVEGFIYKYLTRVMSPGRYYNIYMKDHAELRGPGYTTDIYNNRVKTAVSTDKNFPNITSVFTIDYDEKNSLVDGYLSRNHILTPQGIFNSANPPSYDNMSPIYKYMIVHPRKGDAFVQATGVSDALVKLLLH
ncbi:uncharacterized protein NEMAJ01_1926 [Nematocida major]|uniref:uncharacterized protein n=1 Tax=Nematocida major TaxID=1912982 RepID=UPI002008B7EE|nr:uncharacterized protein NEMAJ01_1926 [Nematocida major]KAH9387030.1 hypothetical protein NEMAJ01_1926 [Nematocida major]